VPLAFKASAEDYVPQTKIETTTAETPLDEIEYKTIEPPEDGWTLEKFNEVFYLNGKQVDFPLSISDLGDNYEYIDDYNDNTPREYSGGELFYKKQKVAIIHYYSDNKKLFDIDTKISALVTFGSFFDKQTEDSYFFVLNGIKLNTPKEEVLSSLGDNYRIIVDGIYQFFLDDNNRFTITFDEKTDRILSILIYIREDI
jgi:hypothetical protein